MNPNRKVRLIVAFVIFAFVFLPAAFQRRQSYWSIGSGSIRKATALSTMTVLKAQIDLSGIAGLGFMAVAAIESADRPRDGASAELLAFTSEHD